MTEELNIPNDLPIPADLHPKFQRILDRSKFPDMVVLMNYDTGNMKLSRPAVAAQATRVRDYTDGKKKVYSQPTWFKLTFQEASVLFPLWCNFLHFDWKAFNFLEKSRDMSGVTDLPEDIKTVEDLRYVTDDAKRKIYHLALTNRDGAGKTLQAAKDMRASADFYCRPSTISTNDFASLEYYRKAKVGFLMQYAHTRRVIRDEEAIIDKEEVAISEEMIKEKAREVAKERRAAQKSTKPKAAKKSTASKGTKNAKTKVGA